MNEKTQTQAGFTATTALPAFSEPLHVGRPNIGNRDEFMRLAGEIFDRRWLSNNGPCVQELEARIADYLGVKHCVAVCNGTIALEIVIRALGLRGEVIVPSYTFIATAHALHWQGITPVFADIDPVTHNLNPAAVRKVITSKTSGIIGVHLWGRPAPIDELTKLAEEYQLQLIFDAAHAFGCSHRRRMIGGFGRAEVLSFHATKFFNTFEGGAIVTNDDSLAESTRLMRNFGFSGFDNVVHPGTNGKMVEMCAAMGLVNLDQIQTVIDCNRLNYHTYREAIEAISGLSVISYDEVEKNNFQYIVVEVSKACPVSRDQIIGTLTANNILARRYFWPGCHRMMPYRELFPRAGARLPVTEDVSARIFSLPTGTTVSTESVLKVAAVIAQLIGEA